MTSLKNSRQRSIARILLIAGVLLTIVMLVYYGLHRVVISVRNLQVENTAQEIAMALNSYYSEYGKLPSVQAGNANTAKLINTLSATVKADPENPKALVFLDPPKAKNHCDGVEIVDAGPFLSGYKDHWGHDFEIRIDPNITAHPDAPSVEGPDGPIAKPAIVWSRGDPSDTRNYENPAKWIKSWEPSWAGGAQ